MQFSSNNQNYYLKSPSPSRVINYQSPTLPKTVCKLLHKSNEVSISSEFTQILNKPENLNSLKVTCINCQNLISPDEIENHSSNCFSINNEILDLEQGSYLNELIYKIKKLEDCLHELRKSEPLTHQDDKCLLLLIKYCRISQTQSVDSIRNNLQSLGSFISSFRGAFTYKVYADRLQSLLIETTQMVEAAEIEKKKNEIEGIKLEVEKYKVRTEMIKKGILTTTCSAKLKAMMRKVQDIDKNAGSISERVVKIEEDKENNPEELKQLFYSLFLSMKMKVPQKIRLESFNIHKYFVEASKGGIQPENWPEFIMKKLIG